MRWIESTYDEGFAERISRRFGLSEVTSRLLASRGFVELDEVGDWLKPALSSLADPLLVTGLADAVARVELALKRGESILIFGDYDVDGVTSTAFLVHFLRQFGANPHFFVPRRLEEGYGLSVESLDRAIEVHKPDLLIAVDCGTSSSVEVGWLRQRSIDVLILDHHTSKEALPEDCILVNPHLNDPEDAPWINLCSVGLVFKFCHAFLKVMRRKQDSLAEGIDLRDYLDLVALGTVADLVPLDGENRILVRHGILRLEKCRRPGILALLEVAGLDPGSELSATDIGFRLGPRINASGRIDEANLPIRMLLDEDYAPCREAARLLDSMNRERQEIERAIVKEAEAIVEGLHPDEPGIVVHSGAWHSGVVGIVASRLARAYHKPAIVMGSESDGILKGSGRSIPGVNLVEVLSRCEQHLTQWGGHPMAVGLTTTETNVEAFRRSFYESLKSLHSEGLPVPALSIDVRVQPGQLTKKLLRELSSMGPFGQGNPEPVFGIHGVVIPVVNPLGRNHIRFAVPRPGRLKPLDCVGWNMRDRLPPTGVPVKIATRFGWNVWRGERSPRLTLIDWQRDDPADSGW